MTVCLMLVRVLWLSYEAWRDNGFKNVDADGVPLRPRISLSRMKHVKAGREGQRMTLLNELNHGG